MPIGLRVKANIQAQGDGGVTQDIYFRVYDPQMTDVALTGGVVTGLGVQNVQNTAAKLSVPVSVWTNTSGQVRVVTDAAGKAITMAVLGWTDPRGK